MSSTTNPDSNSGQDFPDQHHSEPAAEAVANLDEEDDFAFQLRQEAEERTRLAANSNNPVENNANQNNLNSDGMQAGASSASTGVILTAEGTYVYQDPNDGTLYEYDNEKKAWFPKVDEDFMARYQAQYGVYDPQQQEEIARKHAESNPTVLTIPKETAKEEPPEDLDEEGKKEWLKQRKKEKRKLAAERQRQQANWFDMDEAHNTNVYVSGLPPGIEMAEFEQLMTKCGVIARDIQTRKLKLKLYMDSDGNAKGDGLCCYMKRESIELATQILDGYDVRGHKMKVELAHFEMKGEYDPSKKRKKLSAKQKQKLREQQEKLFDWRPDKLRGQRPRSDCMVIIKNVFTLDELTTKYATLKDSLKAQCEKYGEVKKIVIYDNNPAGVASVTYSDAECADDCIKMMDWRVFEGKQLRAERWDGKTKYKVEETEEERTRRMAGWANYLDDTNDAGKTSVTAK